MKGFKVPFGAGAIYVVLKVEMENPPSEGQAEDMARRFEKLFIAAQDGYSVEELFLGTPTGED